MPSPFEVVTVKITVADVDASHAFYTDVIGMTHVRSTIMPEPILGDPDVESTQVPLNFSGEFTEPFICLLKRRGFAVPREYTSATCVSLRVADLDGLLARAEAAGFSLQRELIRVGDLTVAFLADPDGYTVEIAESPTWPPA